LVTQAGLCILHILGRQKFKDKLIRKAVLNWDSFFLQLKHKYS